MTDEELEALFDVPDDAQLQDEEDASDERPWLQMGPKYSTSDVMPASWREDWG